MKPGFRVDIAMLRLLAITTVVAFHAYGMCYVESHIPSPICQQYKDTYEWFNQHVPINVAMPLFMFISGYLFGMQLLKGKYSSLWQVIKDKSIRIALPYYLFLPIMMATYSGFSIEPYYTGGYWHMWFLPALWWLFIVSYLLKPLIYSDRFMIVGCLLFASYVITLFGHFLPNIFGLSHLNLMLCYFMAGMVVFKHEERLTDIFKYWHLVYPLTFIYLLTIIFFPTTYGDISIPLLVGSTCAILVLWYLFRIIPWQHFLITPYLLTLSTYSFGIYIFHNWVEVYLVSTTAKRLFPIVEFAEAHIYIFPLLFSVAAFVISAFLTKLILMTKMGRRLIG